MNVPLCPGPRLRTEKTFMPAELKVFWANFVMKSEAITLLKIFAVLATYPCSSSAHVLVWAPEATCYFPFSLLGNFHWKRRAGSVESLRASSVQTEVCWGYGRRWYFHHAIFKAASSMCPFFFFSFLPFSFRKTIHNAVPCLRFLIRISKNDVLRGSINESSFRTSLSSHHSLAGRTKSACVSSISTGEAVSLVSFPWRKVSVMFL